jgi:hypothetical protein
MLLFVTPPDVRRSFKLPPEFVDVGENVLALRDAYALETGRPAKTHRSHLLRGTVANTGANPGDRTLLPIG